MIFWIKNKIKFISVQSKSQVPDLQKAQKKKKQKESFIYVHDQLRLSQHNPH